jgi:hypothetical protein
MKTIIHVNRHKIRARDPKPLTVKNYKEQKNAAAVDILGPSTLVYRPEAPLHCGAVAWIETQAEVVCG